MAGTSGKPTKSSATSGVERKARVVGCRNSKWTVYLDHLIDHTGGEVRDYLVVEPNTKSRDSITGICVLPILEEGFGLLRVFRIATMEEAWEVPRGFVDPGEEPRSAAVRELYEETGLICAPADMQPLGTYTPEASTLAARAAVFAATRCRWGGAAARDEIGLGALRVISALQMAAMARDSEIEDASTLVAYYRYVQSLSR